MMKTLILLLFLIANSKIFVQGTVLISSDKDKKEITINKDTAETIYGIFEDGKIKFDLEDFDMTQYSTDVSKYFEFIIAENKFYFDFAIVRKKIHVTVGKIITNLWG